MNAYTHVYLYQMCSDFVMYKPIHFIDDYFLFLFNRTFADNSCLIGFHHSRPYLINQNTQIMIPYSIDIAAPVCRDGSPSLVYF